jgi:hypothetical protein
MLFPIGYIFPENCMIYIAIIAGVILLTWIFKKKNDNNQIMIE